jgi:hypothetical protein
MDMTPALAATVAALRDLLKDAATVAHEADTAFAAKNRNLAIGIVLSLEDKLPVANALLQATLALHRCDP